MQPSDYADEGAVLVALVISSVHSILVDGALPRDWEARLRAKLVKGAVSELEAFHDGDVLTADKLNRLVNGVRLLWDCLGSLQPKPPAVADDAGMDGGIVTGRGGQ